LAARLSANSIYFVGRLFTWLMELKEPRFIPGYSGPDLDAALLQGRDRRRRASVPDEHHAPRRMVGKGYGSLAGII